MTRFDETVSDSGNGRTDGSTYLSKSSFNEMSKLYCIWPEGIEKDLFVSRKKENCKFEFEFSLL